MGIRRTAVITALAAALIAVAGLASALASSPTPRADLTVSQTANMLSASPGEVVTFHSTAVNLGPADSQLDAIIRRAQGLHVTRQRCQDVSPDTPACEFGVLPPFSPEQMVVRAAITGAVGTYASLTVCAANEGGQVDPVAVNNCSTTLVRIAPPPAG